MRSRRSEDLASGCGSRGILEAASLYLISSWRFDLFDLNLSILQVEGKRKKRQKREKKEKELRFIVLFDFILVLMIGPFDFFFEAL